MYPKLLDIDRFVVAAAGTRGVDYAQDQAACDGLEPLENGWLAAKVPGDVKYENRDAMLLPGESTIRPERQWCCMWEH